MILKEDEELFLALNLLSEPSPDYIGKMISEGYLDQEMNNTPKADSFVKDYTESKGHLLLEAIKKQGSYGKDKGFVLFHAGIKSPLAGELILEELVKKRKLKKKEGWGYIVRCGSNHPNPKPGSTCS